jgi:hypothetical protein
MGRQLRVTGKDFVGFVDTTKPTDEGYYVRVDGHLMFVSSETIRQGDVVMDWLTKDMLLPVVGTDGSRKQCHS